MIYIKNEDLKDSEVYLWPTKTNISRQLLLSLSRPQVHLRTSGRLVVAQAHDASVIAMAPTSGERITTT